MGAAIEALTPPVPRIGTHVGAAAAQILSRAIELALDGVRRAHPTSTARPPE